MSGNDENISGTKIAPLDSPTKKHVPHADSQGVIGEDYVLGSSHIEPFSHTEHPDHPQHQESHKSRQARHGKHEKGPMTGHGDTAARMMDDTGERGEITGHGIDSKMSTHTKGGQPMRTTE